MYWHSEKPALTWDSLTTIGLSALIPPESVPSHANASSKNTYLTRIIVRTGDDK